MPLLLLSLEVLPVTSEPVGHAEPTQKIPRAICPVPRAFLQITRMLTAALPLCRVIGIVRSVSSLQYPPPLSLSPVFRSGVYVYVYVHATHIEPVAEHSETHL